MSSKFHNGAAECGRSPSRKCCTCSCSSGSKNVSATHHAQSVSVILSRASVTQCAARALFSLLRNAPFLEAAPRWTNNEPISLCVSRPRCNGIFCVCPNLSCRNKASYSDRQFPVASYTLYTKHRTLEVTQWREAR